MRKYLLVAAMTLSVAAQSQKIKIPDPKPFANTITADDLKRHLYIVASKEMEGRGTGTAGERRAAAYIENHFRSLGLTPGNNGSYQMPWPLYRDSLVKAELAVNDKQFSYNKDFALNMSLANSSTILASEVVFVGAGYSDSTRDDYKGVNVRGKIVLVLPGGGRPTGFRRGSLGPVYDAAMKHGAAGILQVQTNFPRPAGASQGNLYTNPYRATNPPILFNISEEVAQAIMGADYAAAKEATQKGNAQPKSYQANVKLVFDKATNTIYSSNVLGVVEGTDLKDEYVFITAHYDHEGIRNDTVIYYGADDDGSGTVSVLELAEAFAKAKAAGKGPRRSVVFMTVSGEERGLLGSHYYSEHPIFPLDKTTVNLNIDMIGRIDPKRKHGDSTNYVYVVGDDKLSSDLRVISESVNKKYTKLELDYKYNDPNDTERIYYRSDHYNFARKGVPIIFYFNSTHADYHRPTDTPDKINYELMSKRAKLIFYTAWEMANRNEMLKRDIPLDTPAGG